MYPSWPSIRFSLGVWFQNKLHTSVYFTTKHFSMPIINEFKMFHVSFEVKFMKWNAYILSISFWAGTDVHTTQLIVLLEYTCHSRKFSCAPSHSPYLRLPPPRQSLFLFLFSLPLVIFACFWTSCKWHHTAGGYSSMWGFHCSCFSTLLYALEYIPVPDWMGLHFGHTPFQGSDCPRDFRSKFLLGIYVFWSLIFPIPNRDTVWPFSDWFSSDLSPTYSVNQVLLLLVC